MIKYAVININNMMPVIERKYEPVNFNKIEDIKYKQLLKNEYKIIKSKSAQIIKNENIVYKHKISNGNETPLARRCCDFSRLEAYALQTNNASKIESI